MRFNRNLYKEAFKAGYKKAKRINEAYGEDYDDDADLTDNLVGDDSKREKLLLKFVRKYDDDGFRTRFLSYYYDHRGHQEVDVVPDITRDKNGRGVFDCLHLYTKKGSHKVIRPEQMEKVYVNSEGSLVIQLDNEEDLIIRQYRFQPFS